VFRGNNQFPYRTMDAMSSKVEKPKLLGDSVEVRLLITKFSCVVWFQPFSTAVFFGGTGV
jgi:hypothetical protein